MKINLSELKTLTVGSVYRHPTSDVKRFENASINVIKSFKANENYVVLGDFNVNYDERSSTPAIKQYINHISSVGCTKLINQPTRITQTSSTIINHIYVNSMSVSHVIPTIMSEDISHHFPIFAEFICKQSKKSAKHPYAKKLSQENSDLFLANLNRLIYYLEINKDCNLEKLIKIMLDLTNQYFPKKFQVGNNIKFPKIHGFLQILWKYLKRRINCSVII